MRSNSQSIKRRLVFWIILLVAVPAGLGILFYANGYRFQPETSTIIQTSALSLEVTPPDINLFLNEKEYNLSGSFFLGEIPAGTYSLALNKANYNFWKKNISFDPGKSQLFPNVILFLQSSPKLKKPEDKNDFLSKIENQKKLAPLPKEQYDYYLRNGFNSPENLVYLMGDLVLLIDQQSSVSYFIPELSQWNNNARLETKIIYAQWHKDTKKLLYLSEFELSIFDKKTNTNTLLVRQTTPLIDTIWHPSGDYIFYSDINGIYALELDPRDHRQVWQLAKIRSPKLLNINENGNELTYYSDAEFYDLKLYDKN